MQIFIFRIIERHPQVGILQVFVRNGSISLSLQWAKTASTPCNSAQVDRRPQVSKEPRPLGEMCLIKAVFVSYVYLWSLNVSSSWCKLLNEREISTPPPLRRPPVACQSLASWDVVAPPPTEDWLCVWGIPCTLWFSALLLSSFPLISMQCLMSHWQGRVLCLFLLHFVNLMMHLCCPTFPFSSYLTY